MSYIPDSSILRGLSVQSAQCFGMPHIGAYYAGKGVRTNRLEKFAECPVCGRPATNSHHVPAVGMSGRNASFTLAGHVLKPALIALCGSGTTGCHGLMHAGKMRVEWIWDSDELTEAWWSGEMLKKIEPHSEDLYKFGCWKFVSNSGELVASVRYNVM